MPSLFWNILTARGEEGKLSLVYSFAHNKTDSTYMINKESIRSHQGLSKYIPSIWQEVILAAMQVR